MKIIVLNMLFPANTGLRWRYHRVLLHAGDSYTIPGNMPHSFEVLEDGEVIDVFTPQREDYLL